MRRPCPPRKQLISSYLEGGKYHHYLPLEPRTPEGYESSNYSDSEEEPQEKLPKPDIASSPKKPESISSSGKEKDDTKEGTPEKNSVTKLGKPLFNNLKLSPKKNSEPLSSQPKASGKNSSRFFQLTQQNLLLQAIATKNAKNALNIINTLHIDDQNKPTILDAAKKTWNVSFKEIDDLITFLNNQTKIVSKNISHTLLKPPPKKKDAEKELEEQDVDKTAVLDKSKGMSPGGVVGDGSDG